MKIYLILYSLSSVWGNNPMFILTSVLLGIGLAMDAFTVSIANCLKENNMPRVRQFTMASIYGIFQFFMPMIGWICVHTILSIFQWFQVFIPWIALILLLYIGIKMILETNNEEQENDCQQISTSDLIIQGIATSIDALSVGFAIANYDLFSALLCSLIIGFVTFGICMIGIRIGKVAGQKLAQRAPLLGGCILILIGIEIFIKGMLG